MTLPEPCLREHRDGWLIAVRVTPRAGQTEITGMTGDGAVIVRLAAAPVDGKANHALVALLASDLGIAKSRVTIVAGHAARRKTVLIETDEDQAALSARVSRCGGAGR